MLNTNFLSYINPLLAVWFFDSQTKFLRNKNVNVHGPCVKKSLQLQGLDYANTVYFIQFSSEYHEGKMSTVPSVNHIAIHNSLLLSGSS